MIIVWTWPMWLIKYVIIFFIFSCYMNSVMQVLYSLPEFKQRYNKICNILSVIVIYFPNLCFWFMRCAAILVSDHFYILKGQCYRFFVSLKSPPKNVYLCCSGKYPYCTTPIDGCLVLTLPTHSSGKSSFASYFSYKSLSLGTSPLIFPGTTHLF